MKSLVRGTFYRLLYMAFSFATGLIISGLAGTELFGSLSIFTVNAALMMLISGMGHDASLYWHRSSGKIDSSRALGYGWLVILQQLALYLTGSLLSWLLTGQLLLCRMPLNYFWLELVYFSGLILTERYITLFYSAGKALVCNRILAVGSLLTLVLPAAIPDVFTVFCLIPFFHGIALLVLYHSQSGFAVPAFPKKTDLSSLFRFSSIVLATNLLQFLAYRTDYWLINYFTGEEEQVGLYAQASRFAQLFWIIPNIMAAMIYHDLASADKLSARKLVSRLIRVINSFNLILAPALAGMVWFLIYFFLDDYIYSYSVFLILISGMFIFCNSILLAAFFSAGRNLRINFFISLLCLSVIIILDLILIPRFGITGAAWANTAAYSAAGLISMIIFSRREKLAFRDMLMLRGADFAFVKELFLKNG